LVKLVWSADLDAIFKEEPFRVEKLARHRIKQFDPIKRQPWTEAWFNGESDFSASV